MTLTRIEKTMKKGTIGEYVGNLEDAVAAIGSTPTTLIIDTPPDDLTGALIIPSTLSLIWHEGNTIGGAFTLTINGSLEAGKYRIFEDTITSIFGSNTVDYVIPEWWGAKGDADIDTGIGTYNYLAITKAANSYDIMKLGNGVYGIEQGLVFNKDFTIISDNATILSIPYTTGPRYLLTAGQPTQNLTDNEALDSDADRGDARIYLPSVFVDTLEINEVILINSDKQYIGDTPEIIYLAGEMVKISSIGSNYVNIYGTLHDSYILSDNAKVTKINTYTFNTIGRLGLKIIDNDSPGGTCLYLKWVKDSKIDVDIVNTHDNIYSGIIYSCFNVEIDSQIVSSDGDGMSVSGAATNIKFRGKIENTGGHCITCAGGGLDVGIPWNIDVSVNAFSTGAVIDAHYGTGSIHIHESNLEGLIGSSLSALYNTISNCIISATSTGVRARIPVNTTLDVESYVIKGCEIYVTGSAGIRFEGNDINNLEISDTIVDGATVTGTYFDEKCIISNLKFSGNTMKNCLNGIVFSGNDTNLPKNIIINDSKFLTSSYALNFSDPNNGAAALTSVESILVSNCEILDGTYVLRFTNGGDVEKTIDTVYLTNILTDVTTGGVHAENFSISNLKLENIKSTTSLSDFVSLTNTKAFNNSVDTINITGSEINCSTQIAQGDVGNTYGKGIIGQNTLLTNTLVASANQGANYYEVLNCAKDISPFISRGSGSPEGVIPADPGSIYFDSVGGVGTTLYVKESGTGNTGWVAK